MKEIGEWNDLIMQNLLQVEPQTLEIGEQIDKKAGEGLVHQRVGNNQALEEMVLQTLLNNHPQDPITKT